MTLAASKRALFGLVFFAAAAAARGDEIVFRVLRGEEGEVEIIRGKILGEDEAGQLRIQVAYGIITKPKELLVEVRPGIETLLEELAPENPAGYLEIARLVIEKHGTVDVGGQVPYELAQRLVFLAIQLDGELYVPGHRLLMGRLDATGKRVGGIADPHAVLRYAARLLRVIPGDAEATAVYLAVAKEVEAAEGDMRTRLSVMLRAYADGDPGTFLRLARPFGRAESPLARALAASGDEELARVLAEALDLACDACQLTGRVECRRCKGRGERPVNCAQCGGKGYRRLTCKTCLGQKTFKLPNSAIVGASEKCPACDAHGEANYVCEVCDGRGSTLVPCEDCHAAGTVPCTRCGGDLWKGDGAPSFDGARARAIARRYDPEGAASPLADGLDVSPIVAMGRRRLDPPFEGAEVPEVVFHEGVWLTAEEKAKRVAARGGAR